MSDINLTIKSNDLIVEEGDKFLVSREGEKALLKFYELKRKVEKAEEKLKALLKEKMIKEKITKVEGEKIKIVKRFFGTRYKITNPQLAKEKGYGKIKEYVAPDIEKIELILETEGRLPEGVEINNERQEQIVISLIDENEN